MAAAGIVASKSAARRAIAEGGAYLNNEKVTAEDAVPSADDLLHGRVPGAAPREAHRRRGAGLADRAIGEWDAEWMTATSAEKEWH